MTKRQRYDYLTFRECLEEFLRSTSTHGLMRVGWCWNKAWRFLWVVWFFICFCVFCITLTYMIDLYLTFPKTTRITKQISFEPFPGVTICNTNPLRRTKIKNTVVEDYRKFILDAEWDVNITRDQSLQRQDPYVGERASFVKVLSKKKYTERTTVGHQLTDMFLHCAYDGRECDVLKDFKHVWNDVYGNCFTFSGGKPSKQKNAPDLAKRITGAGPLYGLNLVLNTEPKEHLRSLTESQGIRVDVHPSGDMPFPEENGISVPANMEAMISVGIENVIHLTQPAGSCNPNKYNRYNYYYSQTACQKICKQEKIYEHCLCVSPALPVDSDKGICSLNDIYSKEYACYESVMSGFKEGTYSCPCAVPCNETRYITEYTLNKWPTGSVPVYEPYVDPDDTKKCRQNAVYHFCQCQSNNIDFDLAATIPTCESNSTQATCAETTIQKFEDEKLSCERIPRPSYSDVLDQMFYPVGKRNKTYNKPDLVSVKVFVREIGRTNYVEESTYTITDFLTQIGGISSLWIGISLLTVVEFGELLLTLFMIPCYNFKPWPESHSFWTQAEIAKTPRHVRKLEQSASRPASAIKSNSRPATTKDIRLFDDPSMNARPLPKRNDDMDEQRKVIQSN